MNSGSPDKKADASMVVGENDGQLPSAGRWSAALDLNLAACKDDEDCGYENEVRNGRMEMDLNRQQLPGEVDWLPVVNGNYIHGTEGGDQLEKSNIRGEDETVGNCIGKDRYMEAADDFERRCCSSPTKIASLPTEEVNDDFDVHEKQKSSISAGETGNDFYSYAGKSSEEIRSKDQDDKAGDLSDAVHKNHPVDRLADEEDQMEYVSGDVQKYDLSLGIQKYESYSFSNLDAQPNIRDMQRGNSSHFTQEHILGSLSLATTATDFCGQSPHRVPSAGMEPHSHVSGFQVSPLSEIQEAQVHRGKIPRLSSHMRSPSDVQSPEDHSEQKRRSSQDNIQPNFSPRKATRTDKGSHSPRRLQQQDCQKQEGSSKGRQSASPRRRHSSPGSYRGHDRSVSRSPSRSPSRRRDQKNASSASRREHLDRSLSRSPSRSPSRRRDQKNASSASRRDHLDRSRSRSPYARDNYRRSPRRRYSSRRRSPLSAYHSHRRSPRRRPWSPPPNRSTGVGKPGNSLFVAGFSFVTTERDLKRKFSKFGRVTDVRIVRDRRSGDSRGFGFLSLDRDEDADAAIRALDQTEWNGRIVLVEKSKTRAR